MAKKKKNAAKEKKERTKAVRRPCRELVPPTEVYYATIEKMDFKITYTLRAERVERWIRDVKREYLDGVKIKIVGLDCEFTTSREGRENQRAATLQLCVAHETLVYQILFADALPRALIEFLADGNIRFCGAAIQNDVDMLEPHGVTIANAIDLQQTLRNPTPKTTPGLVDLANYYIGTELPPKKKKRNENDPPMTEEELEEEEEMLHGWGDFPLSHRQLLYAALDARLGFELGRGYWRALGYNSHCDRLGLNIYE